ncbi:MAG: NAD(P)H-quinone oxidoreductase [Rhodobiaceae bacterium]|nr:NAD(P)H-quinone oxidoreductase [Rhodobiaceae bacterium]
MTAVAITRPGAPEVLKPEQRPVPVPGGGELLIRVEAAGVNRPDVFQREGNYPAPAGASDLPGLEVAGTVAALGSGTSRFAVGDRVCALLPGGGYAEYCTVDETNALPVPGGLSMTQAAALPETFFTVWHNVFQRARLQPGESFLVHGGTSGIGVTAIQLARAFGARVFATAGSAEKCAACTELGAERAVNYRDEDFVAVLKAATGRKGIDVILDMVGGSYAERNYQVAATDGRIVQIATLLGGEATVDLRRIMMKRLTHTGSTLRARDVAFKAQIAQELQAQVWPLIEKGEVKVLIDSTFPLVEAAGAHALMESSAHVGKIVLKVA